MHPPDVFWGFGPFKKRVDRGTIKPGQTIVVESGLACEYTFGRGERGAYMLLQGEKSRNARDVLNKAQWYAKDL